MAEFESDPQFERLKSRLQQNPDSLLFARVAEGLLNRGQVEEAIRVCEEGIRKHPYYITGHMVLGKCYLQKKLFDLAEKEFKRVLLFDPKYIAAHKFYGDLMREVGWENTCEMSYKKILQIDPLDRSAREMLETLEQVKPKERKVVTPEKEAPTPFTEPEPVPQETNKGADTMDASTAPPQTPEQTAPQPEPINIDDDLFAEVGTEQPPSMIQDTGKPEADSEDVSGILEDIFDEKSSKAEESTDEAFPLDESLEREFPGLETGASSPANEPELSVPDTAAGGSDPMETLERFEEETMELEQFRNLADNKPKTTDITSQIFPTAEDEGEEGMDAFAAVGEKGDDQLLPEQPAAETWNAGSMPGEETPPGATSDLQPADAGTLNPEPPDLPIAEEPAFHEEREEVQSQTAQPETPESFDLAGAPSQETETEAAAGAKPKEENGATEERERIVTPTLGEIYAAQGQFAKAINVFELLLKKDPNNTVYREKIEVLRKRMEESQDA